jgi:hypothetical protein
MAECLSVLREHGGPKYEPSAIRRESESGGRRCR